VAKLGSAGDLHLREDLAAPKGKGPMDRRATVDVAGLIDNTPLGWFHAIVQMNTCMVMFIWTSKGTWKLLCNLQSYLCRIERNS
jgi:hypothetical protein